MYIILCAVRARWLNKKHAKAIWNLKLAEFKLLPQCGYRHYYVCHNQGICYDKHVRDCAAAALKKFGTFKKLADEAPLLKQNEPLIRLETVLDILKTLHPTLQNTAQWTAIQNSTKRLKLRKSLRLNLPVSDYKFRSTPYAGCDYVPGVGPKSYPPYPAGSLRPALEQALEEFSLYISTLFTCTCICICI
jgi:hypothetical protein